MKKRTIPDPQRLAAALIAFSLPFVILFALIVLTERHATEEFAMELDIAREESVPPLEKEEADVDPVTVSEAIDAPAVDIEVETPEVPSMESATALSLPQTIPVVATPPDAAAVAMIKSPVSLRSLAGAARSAAGRTGALRRFGGGTNGETSVLRALRWLKAHQRENGSWQARGEGDPTAFALLAFLSHGEDFSSAEFGSVVKAAIGYLADHHGNNMSVYALAEAASIVRTPVLSDLATTAVREFCQRQPAKMKANVGGIIQRYAGVMVIVAAQLAHLDVPELDAVRQVYLTAFREMRDAKAANGFAKVRGQGAWHYMVAGVCLQYLGDGEEPSTRAMRAHLDEIWKPATLGTTPIACCPVRSNYFATMFFFNAGGTPWEKWNQGMTAAYADSQSVDGETGFWRCQDKHIGDQPFWTTCYVAHQLMIYYRYLPTYSREAWGSSTPNAAPMDAKRQRTPKEEPIVVEIDL